MAFTNTTAAVNQKQKAKKSPEQTVGMPHN